MKKLPEMREFCLQEIALIDDLNKKRSLAYKKKREQNDTLIWELYDILPDYPITIEEIKEIWEDSHEPLSSAILVSKLSFLAREGKLEKNIIYVPGEDRKRMLVTYLRKE